MDFKIMAAMFLLLLQGVLALMLLALPAQGQTQTSCYLTPDAVATTLNNGGQVVDLGFSVRGAIMQMHVFPDGTYIMFAVGPNGVSCVIDTGLAAGGIAPSGMAL